MADNIVKRLLDAGVQVTEMSQARAEQLVKDLMSVGGLRRKEAERTVNELIARGRSTTESIVAVVQREISAQVGRLVERIDGLEGVLTDVAARVGVPGGSSAATRAAATPTAAKKSPAKKSTAKKSAAKKSTAKKSAAKKSAAKKSPAKKSPAKKSAAKKSAAKKSTAKR